MARHNDDWIASYMDYTEETEPPTLYRKWVAVSCIAAALQRKCWINWSKTMTWYPNFYIVLVGPSGKARKGTAMGVGESFLHDVDIKLASEHLTREALIQEINESLRTDTSEDGTVIPHSSLTVFSKEFTVFLGHQNLQLMMDLTDWYDCADQWTYRTKNQGTDEIEGIFVNLIGATTPTLIRSNLPEDSIGGGFTSRIIFVYEEDKDKIVAAPWETNEDQVLYDELESDLEQIHKMIGPYNMTKSFGKRYVQWRHEIEEKPPVDHRDFQGYNQRRPAHTVKLSMIMSASRSGERILREKDFERADKLLTQTEVKMPRTFVGMGQGRDANTKGEIMKYVAREKKTTASKLVRRFDPELDGVDHLETILNILKKKDFLKLSVNENGTHKVIFNEDYENADQYV